MNPVRLLCICIALIVAAIGVSGFSSQNQAEGFTPVISRQSAPDFALHDSKGSLVRLADYRGKVVLLDVWATWCTGCKAEMPWFMEFQRKYGKRGLTSIGVAMDDEGWETIAPYLREHPINYRVVATDAGFAKAYRVMAMPITVLIDRAGRVADWHVGVVTKATWEQEIVALLTEK